MIDKSLGDRVEVIRKSGLFDESEYPFRVLAAMNNRNPIEHYLTYGEPRGARPSSRFDPAYYARRYGIVGDSPLLHYILVGRKQGWSPLPLASRYSYNINGFRAGFGRVVLLVHEAGLSGAPVLGWNIAARLKDHIDVIVLLVRGGRIQGAFFDVAAATIHPVSDMPHLFSFTSLEIDLLASEIVTRFAPQMILCNSIENGAFVEAFAKRMIASVTLVHEFAEMYRPGQLDRFFAYSSHVVFPAKIVLESALRDYPALASRRLVIMPQGQSEIPGAPAESSHASHTGTEEAPFIVMGCGNMELRKGIDIFLAAAASLQRRKLKRAFKFVWIGVEQKVRSYDLMLLQYQIRESGLTGVAELMTPTPAFKQWLAKCDVFFMSSRLDPLPNVAIDAMMIGKPVICFEGASGLPEYLVDDDMLKSCAVPYLDAQAAADVIARLIENPVLLSEMGDRAHRQAQRTFRMTDYAASLLDYLRESESLMAPLRRVQGKQEIASPAPDLILRALDTGNLPRFDP